MMCHGNRYDMTFVVKRVLIFAVYLVCAQCWKPPLRNTTNSYLLIWLFGLLGMLLESPIAKAGGSLCLSVYHCVCLCLSLSLGVFLFLSVSFYVCICLSVSLGVFWGLSVSLVPLCLSVSLYVSLCLYLSLCVSLCRSASLCVVVSLCVSLWLPKSFCLPSNGITGNWISSKNKICNGNTTALESQAMEPQAMESQSMASQDIEFQAMGSRGSKNASFPYALLHHVFGKSCNDTPSSTKQPLIGPNQSKPDHNIAPMIRTALLSASGMPCGSNSMDDSKTWPEMSANIDWPHVVLHPIDAHIMSVNVCAHFCRCF